MALYRIDFLQDMYCHIQADTKEEAYEKFTNPDVELDCEFNEYATPQKVEIVSPDGTVTPVEV